MVSAPVVVAEVSANHLGSLEGAKSLVQAVAASGAKHIKFQTYTADTMTLDIDGESFRITDDHALWGGRRLYELYREAHTPWEWHEELFRLSRSLGLTPFSTPFDTSAVDFLETLDPALYKIASMEIGDIPLIKYVASTGRPLVMSTGTASISEVDEAVEAALSGGCDDLTLLLCTSSYPAAPSDAHLLRMNFLRSRYNLPVGLSDHTRGIAISVAAAAMGAAMIERHVTLSRSAGGPDAEFSLEPIELEALVTDAASVAQALGREEWAVIDAEGESRRLKRSLYIVDDCEAGDVLTPSNVRSIRPAGGLAPRHLEEVLGRRLRLSCRRGTPLSFDLLD